MKVLVKIILQFIVAYILSFVVAPATGVGNGWEILVFIIGSSLGVWGVGTLMDKSSKTRGRYLGTLLGAAVGGGLILIIPPIGFASVLLPTIGAFVGYYFLGSVFGG